MDDRTYKYKDDTNLSKNYQLHNKVEVVVPEYNDETGETLYNNKQYTLHFVEIEFAAVFKGGKYDKYFYI